MAEKKTLTPDDRAQHRAGHPTGFLRHTATFQQYLEEEPQRGRFEGARP